MRNHGYWIHEEIHISGEKQVYTATISYLKQQFHWESAPNIHEHEHHNMHGNLVIGTNYYPTKVLIKGLEHKL